MKTGNRFKMAFDLCLENRKKFYLHIFSAFLLFSVLIFVIYLVVSANTYERRINDGIKCDIDNLGYVVLPLGAENADVLEKEITGIPEIKYFGQISDNVTNTSPALQFLALEQKDNAGEGIETTTMNIGIWPVMNIKLIEGKQPEEIEITDKSKNIILYLSEKYMGMVNTGDVFNDCNIKGEVVFKYIVGGFFDADSAIIDSGVFSDTFLSRLGSRSMEYGIVEVTQWENYGGCFFTFDNEKDYEAIAEQIQLIALKNDTIIDTYRISSVVDHIKEDTDEETKTLKTVMVVLMLSTIISLTVSQTYMVVTKATDYGIRLANGVTKKDLYVITVMQNIIKTVIPALLALVFMYMGIRVLVGESNMVKELIGHIFLSYCVPIAVVSSAIIIAVSSIVPSLYIRKTTVLELVHAKKKEA